MAKIAQSGLSVCIHVVDRLLREEGIGQRKIMKQETMKKTDPEKRNQQFITIQALKSEYLSQGYPVLSVDVKKKELLGRLFRAGQVFSNEAVTCFDHDFPSFATGVAVPLGIYDVARNEGYLYIGQSIDSAEFNVACLKQYWQNHGREIYKSNEPILLLLDGGGSNSSVNRLYKQELQDFADEIGREIRVAHFPPYCSKFNPVEHRLFPFVTRAWSSVLLDEAKTMIDLIKIRASDLKCGLKILAEEITTTFKKGVTVFDDYLDNCNIIHDELNPKWNYRVVPM